MTDLDLGPVGVSVNISPDGAHLTDAARLEELGYSALWVPGGQLDDLGRIAQLIRATTSVRVASGIISPDVYGPAEVASLYAELQASAPARFVVGLGGSQRPPSMRGLNDYLDRLDQADPPVPAHRRILAALGPRKLQLARTRCAGAIALLVDAAWTSEARHQLGTRSALVVDQFVVLDTDAERAREAARQRLGFLAGVGGYRANFARMGFTERDIDDLSDGLVDALVAWGDTDAIAARVSAHHAAGADHVVLAVIGWDDGAATLDAAEALAGRLAVSPTPSGDAS